MATNNASTSPAQTVNLRGMQCRSDFAMLRMKKPMSWIIREYPTITEDDKTLLRRWLLGRAPATMPEPLMRKAEKALETLKAAA